jgi:hypothetical protein
MALARTAEMVALLLLAKLGTTYCWQLKKQEE